MIGLYYYHIIFKKSVCCNQQGITKLLDGFQIDIHDNSSNYMKMAFKIKELMYPVITSCSI